jgi:cold shock CspA family protein/ribosome-associated translation inhibitor RaiA
MQVEAEIVLKGIANQEQVENRIQQEVDHLERFSDRITGCRVLVERSSHRHRTGDLFHVRVDLLLPGSEVAVRRSPSEHHAHEDVFVAIRDAFRAARRRLEDRVRTHRGDVKAHEETLHGRVVRLVPEEDHGFLEAADGHHVYFHRHSLAREGLEGLHVGDWVEYVEEDGREGPQAARVRPAPGLRPPAK